MTPTGRIKQHGLFLAIYLSIDILITYLFVKDIGLYGWMLKHIVSPFIFFWVYMIYAKKNMGFVMIKSNKVLMLFLLFSSILLISIELLLTDLIFINFLLGPILLIFVVVFLEKEEKEFLISKLFFKRKR